MERDSIALRLSLADAAQAASISRTSFGLPCGAVGDTLLEPAMAVAQVVANEVRAERGQHPERYVDLGVGDLEVTHGTGETRTSVVGRISGVVGGNTLLRYDRSMKPSQELQAWVEFLALCAVDAKVERLVMIGGKGGALQRVVYGRPADPRVLLGDWLDAFAANAQEGIPFAPSAAWAYAEQAVELGVWDGEPDDALNEPLEGDLLAMRKAAIEAWTKSDACYDPDCARLFPDAAAVVLPVDGAEQSRFEALVASLVRPMLALREPTEWDEDAEGGDE
jgi:exonuclease V gamma subunit